MPPIAWHVRCVASQYARFAICIMLNAGVLGHTVRRMCRIERWTEAVSSPSRAGNLGMLVLSKPPARLALGLPLGLASAAELSVYYRRFAVPLR